jgi:hypothetical protein
MSLLGGSFADADEKAGGLAGLDDRDDLIGLGALEVRFQDCVATLFGCF